MRNNKERRRVVASIAAGSTAVALALALSPMSSATAATHRLNLPGSKPHWLGKAAHTGAVPAKQQVQFGVLLKMRNQAGADALVQSLSTPGSADYGHWLSTSQFRSRFAPTKQSAAAVQSWLRSQGFTVTQTLPSRMLVEASGSAAQVEKAFSTGLENYRFQGQDVHANTTDLSLPANTSTAVTSALSAIVGLDQGSILKKPANTLPGPPPGGRYGVEPCSKYFGQKLATAQPKVNGKAQPYAVCGYTPKQLESAYGVTPMLKKGVTGKGITVAITDVFAAPTLVQDTTKYNSTYGVPQFKKGQLTQQTPGPDGYDQVNACGGNGWYGEETLDVEAVHNMAPGAKVVYIGAKDCGSGLDDAWAGAIDNHTADVITDSWNFGYDDVADIGQSEIDFYQQYSTEAALTGITVNFSSGDDGDDTNGGADLADKTVEFPADLPYVTGAGGTSLEIGKSGQWLGEYGWQNSYAQLTDGAWALPPTYSSGGGGGTSTLYDQPFYQKGVVPKKISEYFSKTPMRAVPDIAMAGDPNTGMIVGETQAFPNGTYWDTYRIGGTSVSSPLLAGMDAVAGQAAGKPIGFANPLYYKMLYTKGLHDIVAPKKPVYQVRTDFVNGINNAAGKLYQLQQIDVQTTTIHSARGYDDETGVGSPDGPAFFNQIAKLMR